ncbi:hypothetical protein AJ79_06748 [Helicocarpus griseus UAMH5409]|uniref:Sensitive to high expression protein 9, mitochondrial n=1 Tax=Helicocarpus griseus UAMH5409 TaxID=1447875 RepID=A0A2B7X9Y7_9EURO|nr:hypothetical protein AJ79_06748 [Helicocarpus griseus UAMH5409]
MQPIPLIFRQLLLRSSVNNLARNSTTTSTTSSTSITTFAATKSISTSTSATTRKVRAGSIARFTQGPGPGAGSRQWLVATARGSSAASIFLRCQVRGRRYYSALGGGGKGGNDVGGEDGGQRKDGSPFVSTPLGGGNGEGGRETAKKESFSGEKRDAGADTGASEGNESRRLEEGEKQQQQRQKEGEESGDNGSGNNRGLPSQLEKRRSDISKQFTRLMDNVQSNIFIAGQRLNDLTGYSGIEKLKQDILALEQQVRETRTRVHDAKDAYTTAINRRSTSQREVNELLQRKHAWTPTDLERFTSLYRSDHANERAESDAQEALMVAEREAEEAAALLSKSILSRYHEEQIWSDKIRRMSTWGTWGLMGVNVLLFLIFQVAVEPWRRRRLVRGFEEKVMEALEKENGKIGAAGASGAEEDEEGAVVAAAASSQSAEATTPTLAPAPASVPVESPHQPPTPSETTAGGEPELIDSTVVATPTTTSSETLEPSSLPRQSTPEPTTPLLPPDASLSPDSWRQTLHDLFSERRINLTQRELTKVALESAAAGAAVMGVLIAVFRPR